MIVSQLISGFATLIFSTQIQTTPAVVVVAKPVSIQEKILVYADKYNVSADVITNIINCESSMNPKALGDGGMSRGLSQIHKKYHPKITDEQAYDEDFAIDFLAKNLSEGKGRLWTCHRNIYGS